METYSKSQPTAFDSAGAFLEDDRQNWLVLPVSRNRDSEALENSNFDAALEMLGGESETLEVHRFGHWGPGWFEIILLHPSRESEGLKIEERLEDYPVLDEEDYMEHEQEEASRVWEDCYNVQERIEYVRKNRSQFEFDNLRSMLQCIRGDYFNGYASELLH